MYYDDFYEEITTFGNIQLDDSVLLNLKLVIEIYLLQQ